MNKQTAATVDQIESTKPSVSKSDATLSGFIGGSLNGGFYKTIEYKPVMAGEKHKQMNIALNIQMLTPLTPAYQKLYGEILTFYVPNKRVWTNAEEFTAQRGGATNTKITQIPNLGGKNIPIVFDKTGPIGLQHTTAWRDSYISSYLPRQNAEIRISDLSKQGRQLLPEVSVLPLRGFKAIYNDFLRNKEYDEEQQEYYDDTVSTSEWNSYLPTTSGSTWDNAKNTYCRAKRNNSYYTNYRTELQGFESPTPDLSDENASLITWLQWENKISEARSEAENAQANTWDIIAKIRGSKTLSEGKVQLIGKKVFNLNYSAITQNTYNNNEEVSEEFRVMGKQGAYSYTNLNMPIYAGYEAIEEGYIHIILHVYAESIFESGFERTSLNVNALDIYRPDMATEKNDVLYEIECSTDYADAGGTPDFKKIKGFKRKYSEYFKLPNCICGDMTTLEYLDFANQYMAISGSMDLVPVITNNTYQFYQTYDRTYTINDNGGAMYLIELSPWKDYTDLLINKNQAIKNTILRTTDNEQIIGISGQNQIFYAGECTLTAILPMDSAIKDNYTTWGEH